MPVMDGVTASRLIREAHSAAQLPIVAMTANAMKADRDRCLDAGMNGFVTKPIDPDELWKSLLTWVKHREGLGQRSLPVPLASDSRDAATQVVIADLQRIETLDVPLGFSRTNNNPAFYASLLRKFMVAHRDCAARIAQELQAGDLASAERRAHTLKGVAGNLGATTLQASAGDLEAAFRAQAPQQEIAGALAAVSRDLSYLMAELQALPSLMETTPSSPAAPDAQDQQQADVVILQITDLLRQDDPAAPEVWEAHAGVLRAVCADAAAIEAALADFDFEQALQLLEKGTA
jgi:two-component system sensor histidine kinase/response regulator